MFKQKKPCVNCPFRKDQGALFGLHPERIDEIVNAPAFQCHKTVTGLGAPDKVQKQQCAGLMALLHKEKKPNQIMQVAERLTEWRAANLDGSNVFDSIEQAKAEHAKNDIELD